jgi:hypothetical protein
MPEAEVISARILYVYRNMVLELDLSNPRHCELKRLMLATHAINQAQRALCSLEGLEEEKKLLLFEHLMTAAIVCYARPFVGSRASGRISKKWEKFDDPLLKALHGRILRLRAKVIAHSDNDMTHVRIIDKGLRWTFEPVDGGEKISFVHPHFTCVYLCDDSLDRTGDFLTLCQVQLERIEGTASATREALRAEMTECGNFPPRSTWLCVQK